MLNNWLIYADTPINYSLGFQDPGSDWMLGIIHLHDTIIFYLLVIFVVVVWFLVSSIFNKDYLLYLHHGNLMELIWTITPAQILWVIGVPSIKLLYLMDEILDTELSVKAIGAQWYVYDALNKNRFYANKNKILKNQSLKHQNSSILLDSHWVTGFSDAKGCFDINMIVTKKGNRSIASTFKIAQDYKDIDIQYSQKNYFNVGQITIHKYEARLEIRGHKNAIMYVIPHFDKYPLMTKKYADYILWKKIILMQNSQQHLSMDGFIKCISFKASLNKGLNKTLKTLFPKIIPESRPILKNTDDLNPNWLSGFTAGDGSFMVIISKHPTFLTGYQITVGFNLGQHQHNRDTIQLNEIQSFQNCGKVYKDKTDSRFVVRKFNCIKKYIIPHFSLYPLINRKQKEFIIWCQIVNMIENREHLTDKGLLKIRSMRDNMRQAN